MIPNSAPKSADIVICGAGIAGIAAAYHLAARHGIGDVLLVEGKVQNDDYTGGLRVTADRLLTLGEARGRYAKMLRLAMNGGSRDGDAQRLQRLLAPHRGMAGGGCLVRLTL